MFRPYSIAVLIVVLMGLLVMTSVAHLPPVSALSVAQRRAIQLLISSNETSSSFFTRGPVADKHSFKLDEHIHIGIVMTNTAGKSVRVCAFSNDFYQNRPQLTRDGKPVSYSENITELIRQSDSGMLCEFPRIPDIVDLKPNVPFRVPSIELHEWYGALVPGRYNLSLKRTFACCADGQWNSTNEITFDVTP